MENKFLIADEISKKYVDKVGYTINLFEQISLSINESEFVSIVVPTGAGKSTLLKILADLESYTSGKLHTNFLRRVFIPSEPSSFPWLNVWQNISFKTELNEQKIQNIIDDVGLHGYEDHFPDNKSLGFRFRISLGRALAYEADLILFDEPFNKMDEITRNEIYILVKRIYKKYKVSFLLGTTNIKEAIYFSDKIFVMKKQPGKVVDEIYVDILDGEDLTLLNIDEVKKLKYKIEDLLYKR
ncbi:MAG: hypothetical protein CR986_09260 [Ignavibacteriae bacterium]|nr:MAG: hypothetical protein CR986_09260 [Ignavibacteriota bacterium]